MRRHSATQLIDQVEREEALVLSPATLQVTWAGGSSFTVSDKRSGVYQHGDTVTWKIDGTGFKKGDTLTISAILSRFSFIYAGTCISDSQDFEVSGTISVPFPKPVRYSWDPTATTHRLIQYKLVVTPALVPVRTGSLSTEPSAPDTDDPCLVIDTSGGPTTEPHPDPGTHPGRHPRKSS